MSFCWFCFPLPSPSPQRNLVHKYYNSSEQKSVLVSN